MELTTCPECHAPAEIVGREVWTIKAHYVDVETGAPRTDNILKSVGVVAGVVAAFVLVRKITS